MQASVSTLSRLVVAAASFAESNQRFGCYIQNDYATQQAWTIRDQQQQMRSCPPALHPAYFSALYLQTVPGGAYSDAALPRRWKGLVRHEPVQDLAS